VKSATVVSIDPAAAYSRLATEQNPATSGGNDLADEVADAPLPSINFDHELEAQERRKPVAGNAVSAIEAMPHLAHQITRLWKTRELNTLIHEVLLDSRDGSRKGFPREVATELMFLAKMNVIMRASETAPVLGITVSEACRLIEKGDHAALGHARPAADIWGACDRSRLAPTTSATTQPSDPLVFHGGKSHKHAPVSTAALAADLQEAPPIPQSVCIDLTATRTLRHEKKHPESDDGDVMEKGFFRCITRELGTLKIPQLMLSDLGTGRRCSWLPSAISFAKTHSHFQTVVLHIDPLSALEPLLVLAIASGLDHLVININLASGKWRTAAEALAKSDPEYFNKQVRRLIASRDELTAKTGHHCLISVNQINHKSVYHLSQTFVRLAREPGLVPFRHISEGKRHENTGNCHCWSPFIEAHIRTNGHLVACAQDHSGYSFTADLKETTFTEAWHSQIFRNTRQRVIQGDRPGRLCEICPHHAAKDCAPARPPHA